MEGVLSEKSRVLILEALARAVSEPAGLPLVGSKNAPGLFPAGAASKQLAQQCLADGLVRVVRTEARGRTAVDICAISEAGLALLLEQANPRPVLEAIRGAIDSCRNQWDALAGQASAARTQLEQLTRHVEQALERVTTPQAAPVCTNGKHDNGASLDHSLIAALEQWKSSHPLADCPLPELYRSLPVAPTIGQFHDALRRLHAERRVYLHPWTGPLYQLPEPSFALLIGHEVAYYASLSETD